ncbi:Unknown protein [Striga hermonthica]|uniref:Uncharacterized protein n=1 Tax=Striga hermonthica TaxID=68872 RepID=A0A9N7RGP9_STRHE|nr:Unknown protein [Striga hermonthica]
MAPKLLVFLILLIVVSSDLTSARKLSMGPGRKPSPTLSDRLYLAALPKGNVPASTPSKKGHSFTADEKLVTRRHLIDVDRILETSTPSPGTGN